MSILTQLRRALLHKNSEPLKVSRKNRKSLKIALKSQKSFQRDSTRKHNALNSVQTPAALLRIQDGILPCPTLPIPVPHSESTAHPLPRAGSGLRQPGPSHTRAVQEYPEGPGRGGLERCLSTWEEPDSGRSPAAFVTALRGDMARGLFHLLLVSGRLAAGCRHGT